MSKHLIFLYAIVFSLSVTVSSCGSGSTTERAHYLTVSEGLIDPMGFHDPTPSFSWKLPEGTTAQQAYSIVVASDPGLLPDRADLWESGRVDSDQSLFVPYGGAPLTSRQQVYWQVRFWDEEGSASEWSEVAQLEMGLLRNSDWLGDWVSLPAAALTEKDDRGSVLFRPQYFRKTINVAEPVGKARLYLTAKGVYQAYVNGQPVGEDRMSPGWTPNRKTIGTLTYDITDLLQQGENTIGVILAQGWYAGRITTRKKEKTAADAPQLLAQLELEQDGKRQSVVTDADWKVTQNGPIRLATIYDGETYDANYELGDWHTNGYDDSGWLAASPMALTDSIQLTPKRFAVVSDQERLQVETITQPEPGKAIFDFGQNNVGVPLVRAPVRAGDTLVVRFAEMLNPDGTMYTDNYRSAISTDYYIAAKDGVVDYRPTFTFHGYRYVELSGYAPTQEPAEDWVEAIVQYTDFDLNGTFVSSHHKLNQLQSNISWGLKSNFFDVPTDCPQRDERLGWTGDAQVIAPTALYNANLHAFWAGYLQSMRAEQLPNGAIPFVVPNVLSTNASSGWGDACAVIPWELYFRTGDARMLEENYAMMLGWLRYYESKANDHIVSMFSFRDWLQPYAQPKKNPAQTRRGDTPSDLVSTAYYARSVELTMRSAEVLGKTADVGRLQALRDSISAAFQGRFFTEDGRVRAPVETQTAYLLAIGFDLLTEETRQQAIVHLKRTIAESDNHLRTGFLGTPLLPLVLDEIGEVDLMYTILFKETYPSWFYSINQGATTMWERWDSYTLENGFHKDGMNSFNHYAYGAIGQWLYERVAGIRPLKAGYKELLIAPVPGGPLTSAAARYDSPYGQVASSWQLADGQFRLDVTVPPNTTATVVLPTTSPDELLVDGGTVADNPKVNLTTTTATTVALAVAPGTYRFEAPK